MPEMQAPSPSRAARGDGWRPSKADRPCRALAREKSGGAILVDCLTLAVNLMHADRGVTPRRAVADYLCRRAGR
jgi:adenosyl cobinamide kinase/adenosyl cobinamide phosphate guanylyltransferase